MEDEFFQLRNNTLSSTATNFTLEDYKNLEASILSITVYSVLLFFGLIGNLVVFSTLLRSRYRKSSRVNRLILNLAIADLIVCCFTIPTEIGWRVTVTWEAGDAACRIIQFTRVFGLYLSSNTIICISMDRYFAIVQPLKLADARRRGRVMLICAWLFAAISSAPQVLIFSATVVPFKELEPAVIVDCLSPADFDESVYGAIYNIFSIYAMYALPLLVTVVAYGRILCAISVTRRLRTTNQNQQGPSAGSFLSPGKTEDDENSALSPAPSTTRNVNRYSVNHSSASRFRQLANNRQSDLTKIERARSRTLKLTILIVSVFILCFSPYAVMSCWYQIDKKSAQEVDRTIQEALFIFAVSNSILNPYLYGIYSKNLRNEVGRSLFCRIIRNCFVQKNDYGGSSSDICREEDEKKQQKLEPMNKEIQLDHGVVIGRWETDRPVRIPSPECQCSPNMECRCCYSTIQCTHSTGSPLFHQMNINTAQYNKKDHYCDGGHQRHHFRSEYTTNSTSSQKSLVSDKSRSVGRSSALNLQRVTAAYKCSMRPRSSADLQSSSFD